MISAVRRPAAASVPATTPAPLAPFIVGEVVLLSAVVALAAWVKAHPGPLPYDINIELAEQHLLLPHHLLSTGIESVSQVNWPTPAGVIVGVVFIGLLLLRRWLAAATALAASVLGDLSSYVTNQIVQRPRPGGHGIVILQQVNNYWSFPSGHVIHAMAFFAVLLFLSFQLRRTPVWLWLVRLVLIVLIVLMGPSRVLEGEHWPSDVLEGLLLGGFWLVLAMHGYHLAARRRPRLLSHDEAGAAPRPGGQ